MQLCPSTDWSTRHDTKIKRGCFFILLNCDLQIRFFNQIEAHIQNCSNLKSCSFNDHIQCATSILGGEFTNEGSSNAQARFLNFIIQS